MNFKWVLSLVFLLCSEMLGATSYSKEEKTWGLQDVRALIQQNRSVIVENLNRQVASENLKQEKSDRLPDIRIGGDGYLDNQIPLGASESADRNSFLYHFKLTSEWDVYTGGTHRYAIQRMEKEHLLSEERLMMVEQEVEVQAYVLLYDIHRNIKYREFIQKSIDLREKEYQRIHQLYTNGLVLKSDLLRSKLYITDLQKDEVKIQNSIDILSEELCVLLGITERYSIIPLLDNNLNNKLVEPFEALFQHALQFSPMLKMHQTMTESEEIALKQITAERRPHLKLFADYGIGKASPVYDFNHQLGGQVGAKVSFSLSSFYKSKHRMRAQKQRINRERQILTDAEENLRNRVYEIYTRYQESLLNIDRALQKIEMSKESMRILRNSYFNQQALLVDVLNSETQTMEASFEWVEAVVDSQKYFWALKQACGYL